jgi:hypothetical protein
MTDISKSKIVAPIKMAEEPDEELSEKFRSLYVDFYESLRVMSNPLNQRHSISDIESLYESFSHRIKRFLAVSKTKR